MIIKIIFICLYYKNIIEKFFELKILNKNDIKIQNI